MAIQPLDYSLDVATPFQSTLQGFQGGLGIRQAMDAQAQAELQRQQQAQMQADLMRLSQTPNPTGRDYAEMMTRYPQLSEHFKRAWETLNGDQQQSSLSTLAKVTAALHSAKPEVGVQVLRGQAEAMRSSGDERGAKVMEDMAQLAELDPGLARMQAGLMAAGIPGGDKVLSGLSTLGVEQRAADLHGSAVRKGEAEATTSEATASVAAPKAQADLAGAQADAVTKGVAAKFAESNAALDLQKKGWDIKKIQADMDIARQDLRIKAMNASIAAEGNTLKRQELRMKLEDAVEKRDQAVRDKAAAAESGLATLDRSLETIGELKNHAGLDAALGLDLRYKVPGTDAYAANGLIETLQAQNFLSELQNLKSNGGSGLGALSDAEGSRLTAAVGNLKRGLAPAEFRKNLATVERLLREGRERVQRKYGMPDAHGPGSAAAAPSSRPPLSSFQQ